MAKAAGSTKKIKKILNVGSHPYTAAELGGGTGCMIGGRRAHN